MPQVSRKRLLSSRICDLDLKIPGSHLGRLVSLVYAELDQAGIAFKPQTYLSDEWGCPHREPLIGIPFYLADESLCALEGEFSGIPAETDREVLMYLRHEVGHAINYAYRLYEKGKWKTLFGNFREHYTEAYKTHPFSPEYVRHIPGWYAQKHPDEDFAETFAVWLTPGSNWKSIYQGSPALKKLAYVAKIVSSLDGRPPTASQPTPDLPLHDLTCTLAGWFEKRKHYLPSKLELPPLIDLDLGRLFPAKHGRQAAAALKVNKAEIIRRVNEWTGLERHVAGYLFDVLLGRVHFLGLKIPASQSSEGLVNFTALFTSLAMNHQINGSFA
jgi:hypothetical protein